LANCAVVLANDKSEPELRLNYFHEQCFAFTTLKKMLRLLVNTWAILGAMIMGLKVRLLLGAIALSTTMAFTASAHPVQGATAPPPSRWISIAPYVTLKLNMTPEFTAEVGATIAPNQAVARYSVVARTGARTLAASAPRIGSYPTSIAAGTVLFEVGLEGERGFCAPFLPDHGVRESQCFIDVNEDGKFDASYSGLETWQGQRLFWGRLARMASMPAVPYEVASVENIAPEAMSIYLKRVRGNKGEFQISFGPRNNGVIPRRCLLDGTTTCRIGAHAFTFEKVGQSVRVTSVEFINASMDLETIP
jgi:hypothetical protein